MADESRLSQAFHNVISTILKLGKLKSALAINISFPVSDIPSQLTKNEHKYMQILISIEGDDIPEYKLEKIFQKFCEFKEIQNNTINNDHFLSGEVGLGLAITKGIIELHQGFINAESNNGSISFNIFIPVQE